MNKRTLYGIFFGMIFLAIFFVYIFPTITGATILVLEKKSCDLNPEDFDFVFAYSPLCPHCRNMAPIITKIEQRGYKVYWMDLTNETCASVAQRYQNGNAFFYVPTFLCLRNESDYLIGEITESELTGWVQNCTKKLKNV